MAAGAPEVTTVESRPGTWEEYEALGETHWTEYIDGCIVVSPEPGLRHQKAADRLVWALEAVLSEDEHVVVGNWGWKPGKNEYAPDVMVVRRPDITSDVRFYGIPVLCVEILSSNRGHDQVTKVGKYAQAGLERYWILDPKLGSLELLVLDDQHYRLAAVITREAPAEADFGAGSLTVDLAEILR